MIYIKRTNTSWGGNIYIINEIMTKLSFTQIQEKEIMAT